jgi:hypothetical protein
MDSVKSIPEGASAYADEECLQQSLGGILWTKHRKWGSVVRNTKTAQRDMPDYIRSVDAFTVDAIGNVVSDGAEEGEK